MTLSLRPYQREAVDAILNHWAAGGGDALIELATGTGKSVCIAEVARAVVEAGGGRVGVVTHVRELVRQNALEMMRLWPQADVGIYSAGLNQRNGRRAVTFASIQTIFRQAKAIGAWDLMLIDEVHLLPTKGEGMYRKFIAAMRAINPDMRIGGLTATPYRLGEGRIDAAGGMFEGGTVYTYGIAEGIRDGFLSPLVSKAGAREVDVSRVAKAGGEFKAGELEVAASRVTEQAVAEIVERGADRRTWLVFCAGVRHAHEVRDAIRRRGISCEVVSGDTPNEERDRIVEGFKAGRIRCVTNVNVLSTGSNIPGIDMIVMLRPTLSTSLYIQQIGRGTRPADGKENCLVLDFSGNVRRHGPVDAVVPREPGRGGPAKDEGKVAEASVRAKACPACEALMHIAAASCTVCGYEWPRTAPKHDAVADDETPILSTERVPPKMLPVITWSAARHSKPDKPPSMRVTIAAGLSQYPEFICFEHEGYPRQKAQRWWVQHGGRTPFPATTDEALERFHAGEVRPPASISVQPNGRFYEIVSRSFRREAEAA
jgi:DNA repair protein RadD